MKLLRCEGIAETSVEPTPFLVHDISVFHPVGELDPWDGGLLLSKMRRLIRWDWGKIVLDLGQVEHVHFRFLGDLLGLATASHALSGGIKLANVKAYTREIMRLAGVDSCFETYDSVAEAVLSFQNPLTRNSALQ